MTAAMLGLTALSAGKMLYDLLRGRGKPWILPVVLTGLLGLSVLPFAWSMTPLLYGEDPVIPYARPDLREMKIGEAIFQNNNRRKGEFDGLLAYLEEHRRGEEYLLGVKSSRADGSNLLLLTEGDVMLLGGFPGYDPILTADEIASLTADGTIRYFLFTPIGDTNEAIEWVKAHGRVVLNSEWKREGDLPGSLLYDCGP